MTKTFVMGPDAGVDDPATINLTISIIAGPAVTAAGVLNDLLRLTT